MLTVNNSDEAISYVRGEPAINVVSRRGARIPRKGERRLVDLHIQEAGAPATPWVSMHAREIYVRL